MATTKFKDMPVHLSGDFIATGAAAPDFELVKTDLGTLSLSSLKGKRVILNIFPSLDTGVCAMSVRKFNQLAASLPDTVVLAISKDLPFAHARFCTVEGIENLVPLSDFRHSDFDENYGVLMADGPLQGLLARSVVVIDREGKVVYTELVPEITQEPDYDRAVEAAKRACARPKNTAAGIRSRMPAAVSNLLLHRTELLFRRPATGTVPVGRQLLEGRTRDDSVLRIACGRIVNPPANAAFILFHGFVV